MNLVEVKGAYWEMGKTARTKVLEKSSRNDCEKTARTTFAVGKITNGGRGRREAGVLGNSRRVGAEGEGRNCEKRLA